MNFSQSKQLDRIVEKLALIGVMNSFPPTKDCSIEALEKKVRIRKRLEQLAFPLEIELDNSHNLQEHERVVTCAELDDLYSKGYKAGKEANNDL